MRFLYFGLPVGAVVLADAGHVPCGVCVWHLDSPGMRRVRTRIGGKGALIFGRPDLDDPAIVSAIASLRPDAIFSWFFPRKIPAQILATARVGAFGVHPSLLPRWRGPDPYFWALRAGDPVTGVTLHRLDAAYDTGAIVDAKRVPIAEEDDAWTLARRLDRPSLALLVRCADRIAAGEALLGDPQDEACVTDAPLPTEDDLALRFDRPVEDLLRLIRAASPAPGASALLGDTEAIVLSAKRAEREVPRAILPGEAWVDEHGVLIRAGDGAIRLTRVAVDDRELEGRAIAQLFRASDKTD